TMKAELNTHGLEKLLDGYGIEMKKEAVFDWGRPAAIRVVTQGGLIPIGHPGVILAQADNRVDEKQQFLDQKFPGFFRMAELLFPLRSALVPPAEKQPDATMSVVARTTPKATVVTTDTVDMNIKSGPESMKPQGEYAQRALAIALEGKLKSAFADKKDDA